MDGGATASSGLYASWVEPWGGCWQWGLGREGEALAPHSLQPAQSLAYLFYTLNESNMSSEETILRLKKKTKHILIQSSSPPPRSVITPALLCLGQPSVSI